MRYIDPIQEIPRELLTIEKPSRWTGGESGRRAKKDAAFQTVIAFPDLYEIGMSNQAVKIIYNNLNDIDGVSCDRVFAPSFEFEKLLKEKDLPLYALDTGLVLCDSDILMFSLGYELGITGVLSILECAQIPLLRKDRNEKHPIVIAGGPCVSNPLPYSDFIDAFWIGEAENEFFDLVSTLSNLKKQGNGKKIIFAEMQKHPSIWFYGKENAVRNIFNGFSFTQNNANIYPIPSLRIVQHHGVVEIMRGCPNGCRFCQAGFWYRPMRQKQEDLVINEIENIITKTGFREISLSSLSSGDYNGIENLLDAINKKYKDKHISFQLPSLHVSTFSLSLPKKISSVRSSSLTFAVETALDRWQMSINKEATLKSIVPIINEAKQQGWRQIKFYFMIGLPLDDSGDESEEIINFMEELTKRTGLKFNINVGVFIPKPHTPYQWAKQIDAESAYKKLSGIKNALKTKGHKVNFHDPFVSFIEGLISRGTENTGSLILQAYLKGCRLDAWTEYFRKDIWTEILNEESETVSEIMREKDKNESLPWDFIKINVHKNYLKQELQKSTDNELSSACSADCTHNCGVCNNENSIVYNNSSTNKDDSAPSAPPPASEHSKQDPDTYRMLFSFSKTGSAVFLSHLSIIEIFSQAFTRINTPVIWTAGFNPLVKLDFASPLSVGISGENEIASCDLTLAINTDDFLNAINNNLPEGFSVTKAELFFIPTGKKKYSVMALLDSFVYKNNNDDQIPVGTKEEKQFRETYKIQNGSIWGLNRMSNIAKNPLTGTTGDYFSVYREIYR
ncbi:MAG: TIGR03936 family radical SAM-associated protein [Spirochaetaceae bacterium]|jgi:radical SAM superfamily enzyme YgiQ (UPF0313 family)|nr:TIGR03936 family radical SAM-associated protein [Spirochaetaceae bacterium]